MGLELVSVVWMPFVDSRLTPKQTMGQVLNDACEHARMATWHWNFDVHQILKACLA